MFMVFLKLIDILKLLNLKMPVNLLQQTEKQAKETKRCMKVRSGKAVEHARLNVFKSKISPENQICHNFVILSKRKTFEKLGGNMLRNTEKLRNQGFIFVLMCLKKSYMRFNFYK